MNNNFNIEYENGYLHSNYAKSYLDRKKDIRSSYDVEKIKPILFMSLGTVIALSQIAEYSLFGMITINNVVKRNPLDDKLEEVYQEILDTFNINNIEIEKPPTLSIVLNNLKQSNLISIEMYKKSKFIVNNRNNFTHNYFLKFPKSLGDLDEMKELVMMLIYTILSMNQLINEVFSGFKEKMLMAKPSMVDFLNDFSSLFIAEFKE